MASSASAPEAKGSQDVEFLTLKRTKQNTLVETKQNTLVETFLFSHSTSLGRMSSFLLAVVLVGPLLRSEPQEPAPFSFIWTSTQTYWLPTSSCYLGVWTCVGFCCCLILDSGEFPCGFQQTPFWFYFSWFSCRHGPSLCSEQQRQLAQWTVQISATHLTSLKTFVVVDFFVVVF